ncbi:energy-coupling factor ABC transporter ATP-binding protein [Thiobaca trueperi]|uniref:ABC transporter ATP-binding protein n=1 Tax=Thiobaca trueperi TaxID=127458 RepID=A0A4R3MX06_9GAMM|nr:ABC transporter ATP-binding protein [Thiobaca trueperi]TCT19273.1 cobalt/nickel transport system ATP-binding protein [Thiobaca trueperi]
MSRSFVELERLAYAYPDGTQALADISLRAHQGESVAIVGANGAGKSTLLLHLNGYLRPQQGRVRIGDLSLTKESLPAVRRLVGMVFQDPDDQLFMPTVAEDVAFGPLNQGLPVAEVERRVNDALQRVGALALRERPPYRLSGGEKRAVAIATVLAMEPAMLVLDEPSSNLDPGARRRLIRLLAGFEQTTFIATHDLDLALDLCSRTVVLREGRIVADGPTAEIFVDAALLAASGLEPPLRMQGCPLCGQAAIETT